MLFRLSLAAAVAALASASVASAAPSAPVITGTVGPGYSISLTKGGKLVRSLPAGSYVFRISDRAAIHNFVLEKAKGGTFERAITSVPFVGTTTLKVRLTAGKWEYYCRPHESSMHGDFTVTG